jgi:PEGA domain
VAVLLLFVVGGGTLAARMFFAASPSSGTVAVTTNPPGVQVLLDGQPYGVSPTTLTVTAGTHVLELRGGGEPRSIPIDVTAGAQLSQYIEMVKGQTLGNLQVRTEPAGGRIIVDGVPIGPSPVTVVDLQPGEHTVVVETEAGTTRQTVVVEAGATASLVAQLPSAAPSGPTSGWISVNSPRTVQLFEDGRLLGSSDTERLMVPTGTHRLEIVNEALGYRDTRTVQVVAGRVAPIAVEFPKGTIALNAVPWADVWIDGEKVGETPIGNLAVTVGSHEVIFRHPELGEQRHVITVTVNGPARLSVDLRKRP